MKRYKFIVSIVVVLPVVIGLYLLGYNNTNVMHTDFHYYYVIFSSVISLLVTVFSYREYVKNQLPRIFLAGLGFLGVTIFYGIHALITPNLSVVKFTDMGVHLNAFVFFGDLSRLWLALMLFAPKLLTIRIEKMKSSFTLIMVSAITMVVVSIFVLMNADLIPNFKDTMGQDTSFSVLFKVAALVLLGVSLIRYWDSYHIKPNNQVLSVIIGIILIIQTIVIFMISVPWSRLWWLAHNLFLLSYIAIGWGVLVTIYLKKEFEYFDVNSSMKNMINELVDVNDKLKKLANIDSLTGLPNRSYFTDHVQGHILRNPLDSSFAIVFIDLDGFKTVNDRLGHDVGDEVLKLTANRLENTIKETDLVARLGGDEFILICKNVEKAPMMAIAQRILDSFKEPILVNNTPCKIGLSIGIAMYPTDGKDLSDLLKMSDTAMYHIKNLKKNDFAFYNELT